MYSKLISTPDLVIALEGGLVQAVVTDQSDLLGKEVLVIDYDTEGADPDEISLIPQEDGSIAEACTRWVPVSLASIDIENIAELKI